MNTKTAADYRAAVGASDDEVKLVSKFLGSAPSEAVYKALLLE